MAATENTGETFVPPRKLVTAARAQTPSSAVENGQTLPTETFSTLNQSVQSLRSQNRLAEAIRQLISFDGTTSSAVFDFVEVAQSGYKAVAYNPVTHQPDPVATQSLLTWISGLNSLTDYSQGYSDQLAMDQVIEMSLLEVATTGGLAQELVLNKARMPAYINVVSYDTLTPKSNGKGGRYWTQAGATEEIDLNIPTFFVTESHKFANKAQARSMMEPSVNSSWYFNEFMEDMRRAVKRQHGRLTLKLITKEIIDMAPPDVRADKEKLMAFLEEVRLTVKTQIETMNPEDAMVYYDTAEAKIEKAAGEKADYVPLMQLLSGNQATSLKTPPSVIGLRMDGSQSLSNTESLLFLKSARGLQKPVETNMSRMLTLAIRLLGIDAYVEFRFDAIDLRPESELEAFRAMKQARVLEQLSLGLITDVEAALELGLWGIPPGMAPLSGTRFDVKSAADPSKASPNQDPQGAALQPKTPKKAGGKSQ